MPVVGAGGPGCVTGPGCVGVGPSHPAAANRAITKSVRTGVMRNPSCHPVGWRRAGQKNKVSGGLKRVETGLESLDLSAPADPGGIERMSNSYRIEINECAAQIRVNEESCAGGSMG